MFFLFFLVYSLYQDQVFKGINRQSISSLPAVLVLQIELPDTQDPVCMDMSTNMLAAGALANICLLDPRRKDAIIGDVRSPDGPNVRHFKT